MLDEAIEILTKQMLELHFKEQNQNKSTITMTKEELYKFCIKLLKEIERYEDKDEK